MVINDLWSRNIATELSGFRDRVVHVRQATLENEVHNQLHFVADLEERHLRCVTSFDENLEARHHQLFQATTENCLLTEEVSFGLFTEGGLDNPCTSSADSGCIGQCQRRALAGRVIFHGNQRGNTLALRKLATNQVAGALRCNHAHRDSLRSDDLLEVNVQAVGEENSVPIFQVRFNLLFEDRDLRRVGGQDHDQICPLSGLSVREHFEASFFGLFRGLGALAQADTNIDARVAQALSVCVAL